MSNITIRQLTDKMNAKCNKVVAWPIFMKLIKIFKYSLVLRCINLIPNSIGSNKSGKYKVLYLYSICKNNAVVSDYQTTGNLKLFEKDSFKV